MKLYYFIFMQCNITSFPSSSFNWCRLWEWEHQYQHQHQLFCLGCRWRNIPVCCNWLLCMCYRNFDQKTTQTEKERMASAPKPAHCHSSDRTTSKELESTTDHQRHHCRSSVFCSAWKASDWWSGEYCTWNGSTAGGNWWWATSSSKLKHIAS